jgi:hypothetical protein
MRMQPWRLALTGGAIAVLATAGVGLALAGSAAATNDDGVTGPQSTAATVSLERPGRGPADSRLGPADETFRHQARGASFGHRLAAAGRHLVHAEITVTDRDGNLVTHVLDRGTISSIGDGSLGIAEAGDGLVTVLTDETTVVRLGRAFGELADLEVGDEVLVHSRLEDGGIIAHHVVRLPVWAAREAT